MISNTTLDRLALEVLRANALELRAVPAKVTNEQVATLPLNEMPFLYASGNWGPGYLMIKGQVGNKVLLRALARYLAVEIAERWPNEIDFVAGNVTGGMIPGYLISEELETLLGRRINFVYIREARKTGGQKELITGIQLHENSGCCTPEIGAKGLDMEELVNFAQTIINGASCLRDAGYTCKSGACILYYDNPVANKDLAGAGIEMVSLLTLPRVIDVAEVYSTHPKELLADYREFLKNPLQWQADRGLTHVEKGGTK
jgi:orotate phosphoribosyltransferase